MSRRRAAAGFTLLEVMLSLAIVATTVFAILFLRTRAVEQVGNARAMRESWSLLLEQVGAFEEVKIDDYKEGTESGTFENRPEARWERITEFVEMDWMEEVDEDHPREMWRITVKVYQMQPDGSEVASQAQFYRLKKEDDAAEGGGGGGGGGGG
jgi:prepilin-type N-terminal cleavage/methylation domain-containing protein